ncbi:MAG: T9SS type A sorting domain-containing protein [Bacteroidetes bacterium]|nr:T9SS type A sorting domain-containing protein [Bacteroidota bacterium]
MKAYVIILAFFFTHNFVSAQNSKIKWIHQEGGMGTDIGQSITSDDNFIYSAGTFSDTCWFGNTSIIAKGLFDIYISKYDKSGNFIWAKDYGGKEYDRPLCIMHNNGHLYTVGFFSDTISFEETTLIAKGECDIFITDHDTEGNLNWVKQFGGAGSDQGYSITTDNDNFLYLSGIFQNTVIFDNTSLTSNGDYDIFLAKLDNEGNVLWINQGGGAEADLGLSVTSDNFNNIYLTGNFKDSAVFNDTVLISSGFQDIFIAKYNSSGDLLWIRKAGGEWGALGSSIIADENEDIYLTGIFGGTAFFNSDTIVSNGEFDIYIAKYNRIGELLWITGFGSSAMDRSYCIVGDNNSIYVTCYFQGDALIGDSLLLDSKSHILQLSNGGIIQDIIEVGNYYTNTCVIDNNNDIYATGSFMNTTIFGDTSLTSTNMGTDIFICKIIYENSSHINYYTFESDIKIFPNPAHSEIMISGINGSIEEVNIYNRLGQRIIHQRGTSNKLDVSNLIPGMYVIEVVIENMRIKEKLIIN